MNLLKRATKIVLILLLLIGGGFYFVVNYSVLEIRYACDGEYRLPPGDDAKKGQVFVKIEKYKWWVDLWSDGKSDGTILLEFRKGRTDPPWTDLYPHIDFAQEQVQVYDLKGSPIGVLSLLSKKMTVNSPHGVFDGECREVSK
jgi:hypothetical protein